VALGVRTDGQKVLLAAENMGGVLRQAQIKAACLGLDELGVGEARDVAAATPTPRLTRRTVARRPRLAHSVCEG
jgi:hypothetical protein